MNKLLLCIPLLLLATTVFAQKTYQVQGTVADTAGVPLTGTIVKLITFSDSSTTVTDANGLYRFSKVKAASFRLIGFNEYTNPYQFSSNLKLIKVLPIYLKEELRLLKAVNIVDVNSITMTEDTVEYKASAIKCGKALG
ncbi:MAG: carboxypeptidase-like regulatory domain-containing protein [Janthinobacterium lividum]